jgi:hypothetical protein
MPRRLCSERSCDRPARKRGTTCGRCTTRAWRKRHRTTIAERERQRTFTPDERAARRASAFVFTYLRRSAITREPCVTCGRSEVVPHWPDLTKPLNLTWFCRPHRDVERERLAEQTATIVKHDAWTTLGERFALQWPTVPPEIQARLHAEAARSPAFRIVKANPESPLYRQQLIAAFGRYCATLNAPPAPSG